MNTLTDRQLLDAFVDAELDLKSGLSFERQLDSSVALRTRVEQTFELRAAIREGATYHCAPDALRQRVAASMSSSQQVAPANVGVATKSAPRAYAGFGNAVATIGVRVQRWLGLRPLASALSFATVTLVAVNLAWFQSASGDRLADEVVASHVRATLGEHLVDVQSSDHHTVKPFLSSKLGFSPPVDELQIAGSMFLGGRVDYLDGRPVAALVYRQGEHVVNSFIWPGEVSDSKPRLSSDRGYLTAHWSRNGMNHWVISDVNPVEFQTVVDAIAKADTTR
jgi:anti-sigma factor RsiW